MDKESKELIKKLLEKIDVLEKRIMELENHPAYHYHYHYENPNYIQPYTPIIPNIQPYTIGTPITVTPSVIWSTNTDTLVESVVNYLT